MRLLRMLRTSGMLRGSRLSVRGQRGRTSSQLLSPLMHALPGSQRPNRNLQNIFSMKLHLKTLLDHSAANVWPDQPSCATS